MSYSKGNIILLPYPFTDLTTTKVRPAIVISSAQGKYSDHFVVPITSRTANLATGEFVLTDWRLAGLNVPSAVKRGCVLVDSALFLKMVGTLSHLDLTRLDSSLKSWFEL